MKYLSHLRELRSRLLYSFIFLIICFFFFLYKASIIGEFLSQPLFDLLKDDEDKRMIFTALPEVFLSNLKISLFASFIFALPFLLIQLILFISPAMYKKEKKNFISNFSIHSSLIHYWGDICLLYSPTFDLEFFFII